MNYTNPVLIDKLAAEYVLGTLHGKARKRFERLKLNNQQMRERVTYWESQLFVLHEPLIGKKPPANIWKNISQRINPARETSHPFWSKAATWRSVSFAMSLVIALIVVNISVKKPVIDPIAQYITVLTDEKSRASWVVRFYTASNQVTVQALKTTQPAFKKAFELWMLPDNNTNPRSLGLMPASGEKILALSNPLLKVLLNSKALAVSVEPTGGSPTGLPTGDIVYTGKVNSI